MNRRLVPALLSAFAVLVLDRLTKEWVAAALPIGHSVPIIAGWINLVHVENPGAAFSLFADWAPGVRRAVLVAYSVVAIAVLGWLILRPFAEGMLATAALGLILGGAAGNLVDRLRTGRVVDFIDAHWGNWHWPAFNAADSAITIGVFLFLLFGWRGGQKTGESGKG